MSQDLPAAKARPIASLPRWKKTLLGLSLMLMISGLALRGYAYVKQSRETPATQTPPPAPSVQTGAPTVAKGFVSGSPRVEEPAAPSAPAAERQPTPLEEWSPAMVKLGFSFFAGFCIAFALRMFFKVAATVIGVAILAAMGLKYAGLVQVDWSMIAGRYESAASWLMAQVGSFKQFVTGQLPSASAAAVGLFAGWKRK